MNTNESPTPTVLLVDDEPNVVKAYELHLGDDYEVRTATGGREALEVVDEDVDVVLLDRRMPDRSGDEVLEAIREAGYDCRVAMVTAVDPDFEIIDMPFDAYLTKPVTRDDVREVVDRLAQVTAFDDLTREHIALVQKRTTLDAEKTESALAENEEYAALVDRIEELDDEIAATTDEMDVEAFETAFRDLGRR